MNVTCVGGIHVTITTKRLMLDFGYYKYMYIKQIFFAAVYQHVRFLFKSVLITIDQCTLHNKQIPGDFVKCEYVCLLNYE
jgi:hypothetical protein